MTARSATTPASVPTPTWRRGPQCLLRRRPERSTLHLPTKGCGAPSHGKIHDQAHVALHRANPPGAGPRGRRAPGHRPQQPKPGAVRQRRDPPAIQREHPWQRRVHHADPLRQRRAQHQRLDHGAADHDRHRVPCLGQAHHRRVPVLRLRPPGPQGRGPRADHGQVDRRPVQGSRRAADGVARPAQRSDPRLLRWSRRSPHGDAGPREVRAPARPRAGDRVTRRRSHQGRGTHGRTPRRPRRRPGVHLQAPSQGHRPTRPRPRK